MNFDLVIFLDVDWEVKTQKNRQHFLIAELARQLEDCSKILGVECPVCLWTSPFRSPGKFFRWLRFKRLRKVGSNLHVYTPFVFLHNLIADRIPMIKVLNRYLLKTLLNRIMKHLDFNTNNLIAWIHHPYQLENIGLVREKRLVYDCYDDYVSSGTSRIRRHDLKEREQEILKRADWVFVVSEKLMREKSKTSNSIYYLPNAVAYDHFIKGALENDELDKKNDQPVLGFTGKITPRLDFQLLSRLVSKYSNWNFVMIGPWENEVNLKKDSAYRTFVTASNVHMLGPKLYQELPLHMRPMDICLLPYKTDDLFNINCSPLKLYEYLATGKPIVSTDLSAIRNFSSLVYIAKDAEEFEWNVVEALEEQDRTLRERRQAAARENSWEKRAKQVIVLFEEFL